MYILNGERDNATPISRPVSTKIMATGFRDEMVSEAFK